MRVSFVLNFSTYPEAYDDSNTSKLKHTQDYQAGPACFTYGKITLILAY